MKKLKSVRIVFWANLVFTPWLLASVNPIEPNLKCGTYNLQGKLKKNNVGDFVVVLNESSTNPSEFIILGGKVSEREERLETRVKMEIYVPKPIRSNQLPHVFFQKFLSGGIKVGVDSVELKQKGNCYDRSKFQTPTG